MQFVIKAFSILFPLLFVLACAIEASPPISVKSVVEVADLRAENADSVAELDRYLSSAESFQSNRDAVRRLSQTVALCTQCLIESGEPFPATPQEPSVTKSVGLPVTLKSAILLRDTMQKIGRSTSHKEASGVWKQFTASQAETSNVRDVDPSPVRLKDSISLSQLISRADAMSLMKERTDRYRKSFRKPGNPRTDSRHATVVALIALTLHDDPLETTEPASGKRWRDLVLEVNGHFVRSANAVSKGDADGVEHFRLGMEACNTCHQEFKR